MFGLGHLELMVLLAVMLLLFGSRLPSVARSLGASMLAIRQGMQDGFEEDGG